MLKISSCNSSEKTLLWQRGIRVDLYIENSVPVVVIIRLGGCVAIALKWNIVILNEVKNLIESMPYKTEILRLKPQNDIVTQPLDRIIQFFFLDCPIKLGNDRTKRY